MRVTLSWTYLIWLTDLSLGNQHYHAVPIRKLCSWTNGFFKIVGFAGKYFLSSLPLPLLILYCARPNFRRFKKRKMLRNLRKAIRKRLLGRLILVKYNQKANSRCQQVSPCWFQNRLQFISSELKWIATCDTCHARRRNHRIKMIHV